MIQRKNDRMKNEEKTPDRTPYARMVPSFVTHHASRITLHASFVIRHSSFPAA